jgi:predicted nucleotidyltransferase
MNHSDIKQRLEPVFRAAPVERAILFGSYARGEQTPSSDVDIVIDGKGVIRGIDFFGILEELREALDRPIDLIEASEIVEGGQVQREIEKTGVLIYESD